MTIHGKGGYTPQAEVNRLIVSSWQGSLLAEDTLHLRDDIVPEEAIMTVQYLLQELPERSCRVFELKYGIGTSPKLEVIDIAKRLDMPQAEVRRVLADSTKSMMDSLTKTYGWLKSITEDDLDPQLLH